MLFPTRLFINEKTHLVKMNAHLDEQIKDLRESKTSWIPERTTVTLQSVEAATAEDGTKDSNS